MGQRGRHAEHGLRVQVAVPGRRHVSQSRFDPLEASHRWTDALRFHRHVVAAFAPSADLFPAGAPAPYLSDCQVRLEELAKKAAGVDQEEKLWKLSEELVGATFA
jgi:hypothetical protein